MRRLVAISLFLASVGCVHPAGPDLASGAQIAYGDLAAKLEGLKPAGASAILFDANGELAAIRSGYADIERGQIFDGATRVTIGELSEIIVSVMMMRCAEQGKIDLDRPFGEYGTIFPISPDYPAGMRIRESSVREMLYHGTGIRANYALALRGYDPASNAESFLRRASILRPPRVARIQSSALIDILGLFASSLYGGDLKACSAELVFTPLDMRSSSYGETEGDSLCAKHYKYGQPMTTFETAPAPSLSFVADSHDLVRFFRIFLSGDSSGDRSILSPASIDTMLSSQSPEIERNQGVAAGLPWLLTPPGLAFFGKGAWYTGKYIGHRTCVILLPDIGIGAVAITNAWAWDAKDLLYEICSSLLRRYATDAFGIREPPERDEETMLIPDELRTWLDGVYASELGPVLLRLDGPVLKARFEGIEKEFSYRGGAGFTAAASSEVRTIRPAGVNAVDLEFASGRISPASPKLEKDDYPLSWAQGCGIYRRTENVDASLPYAIEIRLSDGIYTIGWGDGREYSLIPAENETAQIICSGDAAFFGEFLRFAGPETVILGANIYKK